MITTKRMDIVSMLHALKYITMIAVLHANLAHGRSPPNLSRRDLKQTQQLCPAACTCYDHRVDCNSMQLSHVPKGLPTRTKVLILNDNVIEKLKFVHLQRLAELEELHVRGNRLMGIQSSGLSLLPKLRVIDLSDNPVVCDCELAWVVNRTLRPSRVEVKVGETKCVLPPRHAGERVTDVLAQQGCMYRDKRHTEEECYPEYCQNGATCTEGDAGRLCFCPPTHEGVRCEKQISPGPWEDRNSLTMYLEDLTDDTIKISWRITDRRAVKYLVSILILPRIDEPHAIWTTSSHFTFINLTPGSQYKVCVTAVTVNSETLSTDCELFLTHPPPSRPGPEPFEPSPEQRPDQNGENKYKNDDTVHKAAVILGSIIGICAFFIICLTLVYKFRSLRNTRIQHSRSPSPMAQRDPQSPQEDGGVSNPGRDIIVLSMTPPNNPAGSSPETTEASGHELVADTTLTISDPNAISTVLEALKQQGYCAQQEAGPSTTPPVAVSLPSNTPAMADQGSNSSQGIPTVTTPIFLVADGAHYPLDPTLSEVLRSAMSRTNGPCEPVPNEPPPPYTERADNHPPTPPLAESHET